MGSSHPYSLADHRMRTITAKPTGGGADLLVRTAQDARPLRSARRTGVDQVPAAVVPELPVAAQDVPPVVPDVPTLERTVRDRHEAGHSQRAIARDLNIDRRKVKRLIERAA